MGLETSDFIGIGLTGLGALMGTLGRRVVRLLGMVLIAYGIGGLCYSQWNRPPTPARPAIAEFPIGPAKQSPTKRLWPF